jgi:hypothetical protein
MMATSYFMTGQKSGSGGGVGFASTVQVIAPDGSVQIRPVNAHGGYVDAAIETYDYDDSLCFMDAVSDLDPGAAPPLPETNMATEPLATEGFAMASWNLDENSSDGYNSIPSEGSWSWNGSTSGGDFRDAQLQTVYDNVDESSGHGSAAQLAQHAPKTSSAKTGSVLPLGRAKAAVNRATTGNSSNRVAAAAATTTTTTAGAAAGGGDESIQSNNSFFDRVKNAFRDSQTEDQTSHASGTNSARMATSTNAQTTYALSTAQAAATSATLSQSRATTATVPPQTRPTSLPTSPHPLPTAAFAAARPAPTIPPTPPAPPAVPSAYVLLEKQLVDFVCSTRTHRFSPSFFCRQLQQ